MGMSDGNIFLPFKEVSSITNENPITSAPNLLARLYAASAVPPVAIKSS